MNFFSLIRLTQNKTDFVKMFVLFLLIILLLNKLPELFTNRFIISVSIAGITIYIYMSYRGNQTMSDYKTFKYKLKLIEDSNLNSLNNDMEILNKYSTMSHLKNINKWAFNDSMKNMNQFLKVYQLSQNNNLIPSTLYESAKYRRTKALNELMSIVIMIPPAHGIKNKETGDKYIENIMDQQLQDDVKILRKITGKYLVEMAQRMNNRWNTGNPNIFTKPIYLDKVNANSYTDPLFSKHFNIY